MNEEEEEIAYPTYESYKRRPIGNICPVCGKRILLLPKQNFYYWRYFFESEDIPVHPVCSSKLR
jgi:hypothetical protein